jgi:hypothetical protein
LRKVSWIILRLAIVVRLSRSVASCLQSALFRVPFYLNCHWVPSSTAFIALVALTVHLLRICTAEFLFSLRHSIVLRLRIGWCDHLCLASTSPVHRSRDR